MIADRQAEIIVGTYEDYVVGYQIESIKKKCASGAAATTTKKLKTGDTGKSKPNGLLNQSNTTQTCLEQSFAVRGHSGSVRCLASSSDGSLVFSAGQDEMMNLFSLRKRKLLQTSEGQVTCANFVESSHLICGSDDGNIYIHECSSTGMKKVKTLRGHKAGITAIDTHKSGKLLLSLSRDNTMRTWNLIKGRCAYVTNIGIEAHIVKWARGSHGFLIAANKDIYLYNSLGSLKQTLKLDKRVNSIEFIGDNMFVVATDSGKLEFFHIAKKDKEGDDSVDSAREDEAEEECKSVMKFEAHESRIKSVRCLITSDHKDDDDDTADEQPIQFVTASSDGLVKMWSQSRRRDTLGEPQELVNVDVGARLTCMIASELNRSA